ncbi:unnamed protein product, partial [marine sediment metagenome]
MQKVGDADDEMNIAMEEVFSFIDQCPAQRQLRCCL